MDIRFWDVFDRNIVVCKCVMYVIIKMLAIFSLPLVDNLARATAKFW